jgi:DNA repair protein RecO (recombination protein O)
VTLYRDVGVILRTYKLRESDRIVVLMTEQHGKVRAVARGVRKPKSVFAGRLEPLSHVSLLLRKGKELDSLQQAESIDAFRVIKEDYDRMYCGVGLLEAVDLFAQESEKNEELYTVLVRALRELNRHNSPLLLSAFYFRLLTIAGLQPQLDVCVVCEQDNELIAFSVEAGGAVCRMCRHPYCRCCVMSMAAACNVSWPSRHQRRRKSLPGSQQQRLNTMWSDV